MKRLIGLAWLVFGCAGAVSETPSPTLSVVVTGATLGEIEPCP